VDHDGDRRGKRRIVVVIGHRAPLAPVVDDPFSEDMSEFEEEFEEPDEWGLAG
jgi:hypothetical protein